MADLAATIDLLATLAVGALGLIALVSAVCMGLGRPTGQGRDRTLPEED